MLSFPDHLMYNVGLAGTAFRISRAVYTVMYNVCTVCTMHRLVRLTGKQSVTNKHGVFQSK